MEIKVTAGTPVILAVAGQLDTRTALDFEKEIQAIINGEDKEVVFDVEELTYVSSAGLRLILTLQKGMTAKGGTLVIRNVQPDIMEIFNITGFSSILTLE